MAKARAYQRLNAIGRFMVKTKVGEVVLCQVNAASLLSRVQRFGGDFPTEAVFWQQLWVQEDVRDHIRQSRAGVKNCRVYCVGKCGCDDGSGDNTGTGSGTAAEEGEAETGAG